jgi:hypothetical protein
MSVRVRNALPAGDRAGSVVVGGRSHRCGRSASSGLSRGVAVESAAAATVAWSKRLEPDALWRGVCPCVGMSQRDARIPWPGSPRPGLLPGATQASFRAALAGIPGADRGLFPWFSLPVSCPGRQALSDKAPARSQPWLTTGVRACSSRVERADPQSRIASRAERAYPSPRGLASTCRDGV